MSWVVRVHTLAAWAEIYYPVTGYGNELTGSRLKATEGWRKPIVQKGVRKSGPQHYLNESIPVRQ